MYYVIRAYIFPSQFACASCLYLQNLLNLVQKVGGNCIKFNFSLIISHIE